MYILQESAKVVEIPVESLSDEEVVRPQEKMLKLYHIVSNIGEYKSGIGGDDIEYLLSMIMPHYEYEDSSSIREPHRNVLMTAKL